MHTGYLTNSCRLEKTLRRPVKECMVDQVVRAVTSQLRRDGRLHGTDPGSMCAVDETGKTGRWDELYWDDSSGRPLPPEAVHRARYEELEYIKSKEVYEKGTHQTVLGKDG